jgi:hypothetical protein
MAYRRAAGPGAGAALLPDRSLPALLATVRLTGPHRTSALERRLYAVTLRAAPVPEPYTGDLPLAAVRNELVEAARLEGADLHFTGVRRAPHARVLNEGRTWRTGLSTERRTLRER